jgi:hypothetical protein
MDAEVARRRGQAGADANGKAISTADMLAEQYGAARTGAGAKDATTDAPAAAPTDFFGRIKAPAPIEANGKSRTITGPEMQHADTDFAILITYLFQQTLNKGL